MNEKKFTIAEIMAAFDAVKRDVDEMGGPGAGETERVLIDDVATDVKNFLIGEALWVQRQRELDDDGTLFLGQNYNWVAANGEW